MSDCTGSILTTPTPRSFCRSRSRRAIHIAIDLLLVVLGGFEGPVRPRQRRLSLVLDALEVTEQRRKFAA